MTSERCKVGLVLSILAGIGGCDGPGPSVPASASGVAVEALNGDPEYIQTPSGRYHRSCVHEVPDGAQVDQDGRSMRLPNGKTIAIPACNHPAFPNDHKPPGKQGSVLAPTLNHWLEAGTASLPAGVSVSRMEADFVVPSFPESTARFWQSNVVVYLFPGAQNADAILQPVLQFGNNNEAGGGYWLFASWRCGDSCFHGSYKPAFPGNLLHGTIQRFGSTHVVTTENTSTGDASVVNSYESTLLDYPVGGALEVYNIESCDELPASGSETFWQLHFYDQNSSLISPSWESSMAWDSNPWCGFGVGLSGDYTTLYFPNPAYRGCWSDDGNRALPYVAASDDPYMTPLYCRSLCHEAGFAYAGLQWYSWCFCGDELGYEQRPDSECNTPCAERPDLMCGGAWRNSIYTAL